MHLREFVGGILCQRQLRRGVSWTLYQSGKFIVSAAARCDELSQPERAALGRYRTRIRSVEIGADITSIGAYAFYGASI